jgi:hypothetical protein
MSAPTKTQLEAYTRRRNFHLSIEQKAADLEAAKLREEVEGFGEPLPVGAKSEADTIEPKSFPAETDPPKLPLIYQAPGAPVVSFDATEVAHPTIAEILKAVAKYYRVRVADIKSARRTHDVVLPRQVAMYLSKELTPFSLPVIGRHFGGRDHTTILWGVRKVARLVQVDQAVAYDVVVLLARITGAAQ